MPILFIGPAVIILFVIGVFPLVYSLNLSLHRYNLMRAFYGYKFVGLQNYIKMFNDSRFLTSLTVTGLFVGIVVSIEFIFGLGVALLLSKGFRRRMVTRSIVLLPMMITPVVVALMGKHMLNSTFGVVNYLLSFLGIEGMLWHGSPKTALLTLILMDIWEWTPFITLILLAGIASLPMQLYEASRIDGASKLQQFSCITLPLLKPMIVIAVLLRLIDAVKEFDKVFVLTKGGPGLSTSLLSIYTYRQGIINGNMGYASALSWFLLFFILILCSFFMKTMRWKI